MMNQLHRGYSNGYHQRNVDEYEDDEYDEYEDEGLDGEEEDERKEEQERKPSKEELDFLKLREKLKEKFRQKLKKQSAKTFGLSVISHDNRRTSSKDNFGSFFGPSQPIIASRVLDESRSIRETKHIISKPPYSSGHERVSVSASLERKSDEHHQRPKANEVKRKAQTLKDMRDYSFLLSDDADFLDNMDPQPASCHALTSKPDVSTQVQLKNKIPIKRPLKSAPNGHELKNLVSSSQHTTTTMKGAHVSRTVASSSEPRKVSGNGVGVNGHSRPVGSTPLPKSTPSKVPAQSRVPVPVSSTSKLNSMAMNGSSLQKNNLTARPHSSTQNHCNEQKRASQAADRVRAARISAPPSQKAQLPKPNPARNTCDEPPPRKKLVRKRPKEDDESVGVSQMIRNMFGYNPNKYAGMDDDDSDMEAGFSQILMEERRSAQIAKEEDDEQMRLIEEEERQERMRKRHKANKR